MEHIKTVLKTSFQFIAFICIAALAIFPAAVALWTLNFWYLAIMFVSVPAGFQLNDLYWKKI